jgi:hypothetical protein
MVWCHQAPNDDDDNDDDDDEEEEDGMAGCSSQQAPPLACLRGWAACRVVCVWMNGGGGSVVGESIDRMHAGGRR